MADRTWSTRRFCTSDISRHPFTATTAQSWARDLQKTTKEFEIPTASSLGQMTMPPIHHDIVQSNAPPKMHQRQLRHASTKPPAMGPRTEPLTDEKTIYATAYCWVSASHISAHSQGGGTFCGRKAAQARQTTRGPKLCQSGGKLLDVHEE